MDLITTKKICTNGLMNHATPPGLALVSDFPLYNHTTPTGLALVSDFAFYNHFTPAGFDSVLDSSFYNHNTPWGFLKIQYNFSGFLKSRRDDMIMEQLFNKQLNPEGVTY